MNPNIEDILKWISDYGIALILSGIVIYVIIRLINIGLKYLETKIKDKKHDKLLDLRSNINEKVHSLIEQFLDESDGSRLQVIEFSNSVTSVAYLPFKYMSCTYEVYQIGEVSTGSKIDRLSTSLFTTFFSQLYNSDYVILDTNHRNTRMGGAIYDLMQGENEHRCLCCILRTSKGKALGYVALKKDGTFTKETIEGIQILADKISALLGVMDK